MKPIMLSSASLPTAPVPILEGDKTDPGTAIGVIQGLSCQGIALFQGLEEEGGRMKLEESGWAIQDLNC
jgi:hypothetical protein